MVAFPILTINAGRARSGKGLTSTHFHGAGLRTIQSLEKPAGAGEVFLDLRAQGLGAAELTLFAQALPEVDFHRPCGELLGEVEQVAFDSQSAAVEGRADADVGCRAIKPPADPCFRDVHADPRQQLLFGLKVQGRKDDLRASAGAATHLAAQNKWPAEQACRSLHSAVLN